MERSEYCFSNRRTRTYQRRYHQTNFMQILSYRTGFQRRSIRKCKTGTGRKIPMNALNKSQAMVPKDCTVINNPVGSASVSWFERDGKVLVSMPGVPQEMTAVMTESVLPKLHERSCVPACCAGLPDTRPWRGMAHLPIVGHCRKRLVDFMDVGDKDRRYALWKWLRKCVTMGEESLVSGRDVPRPDSSTTSSPKQANRAT